MCTFIFHGNFGAERPAYGCQFCPLPCVSRGSQLGHQAGLQVLLMFTLSQSSHCPWLESFLVLFLIFTVC